MRDGADVVIGGVGQTDTSAMLDPVTGAGVVLIVPGTVASLDVTATMSGYLFRLTPPDTTQGAVLANVVAEDGITHVTVLDEGGNLDGGMAATFQTSFTNRGGAVTDTVPFSATDSAASVIDRATTQPTDGFVLLGDLPSDARLLAELYSRNLGPTHVASYVANISPLLANFGS
jgi:ABC-type branched-subunit amino acid transport system substrate-binding protein